MGVCSSCEATVPIVTTTAKLVLPDEKLQEFDRPVKVSQVLLQKDSTNSNNYFVCNSDEMEYNGFLLAMSRDEELQMGQLYFLLPQSMLKKPLHADDMAALAVKASTALMKASATCCHRTGTGRQAVAPLQYHQSLRPAPTTLSPRSRPVTDHAGQQGSHSGTSLRAKAEIMTISSTANISNMRRQRPSTHGICSGRRHHGHFQSNLGPILE